MFDIASNARVVSLKNGENQLKKVMDQIFKSIITHAEVGLYHASLKFEGEWISDFGNQDIIRKKLIKQDITVLRMRNMLLGDNEIPLVRFDLYWGNERQMPKDKPTDYKRVLIFEGLTPPGTEAIKNLLKTTKYKIRVVINQNIPTDFDQLGEIMSEKRVELVTLNFDDPISFCKSFRDVHYVFFAPPIENREIICDQIIITSTKFHVEKILFLSILGSNINEEGDDYASTYIRQIGKIEENLKTTLLNYTILRPLFFQFGPSLLKIYEDGIVKYPKERASFISVEDIGKCISRVLSFEGYENQTYDLTGAQVLDLKEIAHVFSERFDDRNVDYQVLSIEDVEDRMEEQMIDEKKSREWISLFKKFSEMDCEIITEGVKQIMGRNPSTFHAWSQKNQNLFDDIDSRNKIDENSIHQSSVPVSRKSLREQKREEKEKKILEKEYHEWLAFIENLEEEEEKKKEERRTKEDQSRKERRTKEAQTRRKKEA
eukprot:TRINITY_DN3430_c1_g2_i1.p1 TRINITY_DN3430_c1_g2~~TRINITY_DN3430_c1_g2_i1.p1  ORF type:complete len:488 (-),score=145.77 TRINITY_DN3430_c1_g2_i1:3146-4609(-)